MLINRTPIYSISHQKSINNTNLNKKNRFKSSPDQVSFSGILNIIKRNNASLVFENIINPEMIINKPGKKIILKNCHIKSIVGKTIEAKNSTVTDLIKGKKLELFKTKADTVSGKEVIMNNCRFIKNLFAGSAEIAESFIKSAEIRTSFHIRNNSIVEVYQGKLSGLSYDNTSNLIEIV